MSQSHAAERPVPHAPFTLRQLECFAAVAGTGSVAAAAEALHASESAVSEAITVLERALGAELVRRRRARGATLTSDGLAVLPLAHRMLAAAEELSTAVRVGGADLAGPIRLGAVDTLAPVVVPRLIALAGERWPRLRIAPRTGDAPELIAALEAGELDALIAFDIGLPPELARRSIGATRATVVVAADHRLAGRERVSLAELADEPMVLLDIQASRVHTLELLSTHGITPRVAFQTTSYELCRSLVGRGLGWTLLMRRAASLDSWDGGRLAVVEIDPAPRRVDLVIAWPETASPPRVSAIVEAAEEVGAAIARERAGAGAASSDEPR